jgi:amidase
MSDAAELAFAGIARQAELVRAGEVSSAELVGACLERIARLDERATAEAAQADARRAAGDERPLLGVPIAIKDVFDVAGELTAHGTRHRGTPAARDAELVRRLRAAGAIVVGKTHTPELAQWGFTESAAFGVTRNPWRPDRTPGGSSGGSAAAVATGMVGAASASDGLGSIRIPAACCGLFGLKPGRGLVPLAPHDDHWHGLSVAGAVTRSVLDTAAFLDAVADVPGGGAEPFVLAARRAPARLRVVTALNPPPGARPASEPVARAVGETARLLASLGHSVTDGRIDYGLAGLRAMGRFLRGVRDDAEELGAWRGLERRTRAVARIGSLIPTGAIARERADEPAIARRLGSVLDAHDVLLMPTIAAPAAEVGLFEGFGAIRTLAGEALRWPGAFTPAWNLSGHPAAAVPAGFDAAGRPLSVQLVARPGDEATLVGLAAQLESERPWAHARPPTA